MEEQKTVDIDEKVVERLLRKIILLEKRNLQTNELGYGQMVNKIKVYIEDEVECY